MKLDKSTPLPLHYQLTAVLREKLVYENWMIGDLFPTEKELMAQYELSSTTVRRALSELVLEGYLERKAGRGTFVRNLPVQKTIGRLIGFFQEMKIRGFHPSAQVLSCGLVECDSPEIATSAVAQSLRGQQLFMIERIININDKPIAYMKSYWPYEYGTQLAQYDLTTEGLYEIAARELHLILSKAEQIISARVADAQIASFLNLPAGSALLVTERLAFTGDKPVEYSLRLYCADQYNYQVTLYQDTKNIQGITVV